MELKATWTSKFGGDREKVTILKFLVATSDRNQQYVVAVIAHANGRLGHAELADLTVP
jgi:hypothetical protein